MGFPDSSAGKESACSAGDPGSIPGLGRFPGGGHGKPLQYFWLENPHEQRRWKATVHGVSESDTTERLSTQMTNFVEHLFIGLFATCKSSLVKCLFRHFAHFRDFPCGPEVKTLSFQCRVDPAGELRAPCLVVPWPKNNQKKFLLILNIELLGCLLNVGIIYKSFIRYVF